MADKRLNDLFYVRKVMEKYRIYIDEVGNADLGSSNNPNHRYLSLTGIIFELDYIRTTVYNELEALKTNYFRSHPDNPVILHRKELVNKKYPFKALKNPETEAKFNNELLSKLKEWDYTVISVVIDKQDHNEKYGTWKHDPYHYCIEVMLERFYYFLSARNAVGDVMIESRGAKEDRRLEKSYRRIFEKGTNYIRSEYLQKQFTTRNIKVKPKTANISGLQIADILAYPARRYIFKQNGLLKDKRITFNEEIIKILET